MTDGRTEAMAKSPRLFLKSVGIITKNNNENTHLNTVISCYFEVLGPARVVIFDYCIR